MQINRYLLNLTIVLFTAFAVGVACTDDSEGTGLALVNIRLIDAPGDFDEAWIEIEGVELMLGTDRQGADGQWLHIPYDQPNRQVDVSKLVGSGILLLGRTEVPVGGISKIKMILGEDHYLMKNGKRLSLTTKEQGASTVEMEVDYRLGRNFSYDIYLDFDLEQSIEATPDSMQFLLNPRIRSFVKEDRGEVAGRTQPAAAKPVVYGFHGKDTLTTLTDGQGNFSLRGLEEGEYAIHIRPRPPYLDTLFFVEVVKGEATTIEDISLRLQPNP